MQVKGLRVVLLATFAVILVASVIRSMWVLAAAAVIGILGQLLAIVAQKDER